MKWLSSRVRWCFSRFAIQHRSHRCGHPGSHWWHLCWPDALEECEQRRWQAESPRVPSEGHAWSPLVERRARSVSSPVRHELHERVANDEEKRENGPGRRETCALPANGEHAGERKGKGRVLETGWKDWTLDTGHQTRLSWAELSTGVVSNPTRGRFGSSEGAMLCCATSVPAVVPSADVEQEEKDA